MKSVVPNLELASLLCRTAADSLLIGNILDSMSDSVLVLDEKGQILCCNRITQDVLGYDPLDLITRGLETLILGGPENTELHQILFDMIRKRSIRAYAEVDYHHPDHCVRRLAVTTSHLVDVSDRETSFVGFVALLKDITEVSLLRQKEKQLIQEKHRIAAEKARSLQKVAMGVAHEIRNPMVTIGGFTNRIAKAADKPEQVKQYAENVLAAARQLETIVEAVNQCCNLPVFNAHEGSMSAVIRDAVSEMTPEALKKNVILKIRESTAGDRRVVFDPVLMKKAICCLIQNAIDFSENGAEVDVSLDLNESGAILEVRDHGIGIEQDDLEYIFDPFFSTVPNRSGMGLAVVERVVQEHMGTIDVESKPGQGTAIRILFRDLRGHSSG